MTEPKKLFIKTYGCQMNVYDSERMAEALGAEGYVTTENADEADMVLLNTCHIREKAAEKVYSDLGRLRPLKQAKISGHRGTVLHGGDALGGVEPLSRLELSQPLLLRRMWHVHKQRNKRGFHHQTCRFSAARTPHDHATSRVSGAGVVFG